jgi:hypothetical protein
MWSDANPKRRDVWDAGFLVVFWGIAAATGFDSVVVFVAVLWTLRILIFERKGYRLVTRGRSWSPSKDPDDYR